MTIPPEKKRRDAQKARARILAAAQKAFSEKGYAQTGIRDIAARAEVSSTLLIRYFGSKARLFEAALIDAMRIDELLQRDKRDFGQHLAALFLNSDLEITPPSMIALSTSDEEARLITARICETHVIAPFARWLGPPDGRARALEIMLLATGFVLYTRQLPELFAARGTDRKLASWFAESAQAIIDRSN